MMPRPLSVEAMSDTHTLYLVDGTAQLFRAYFAIRGLTSPSGVPTNAVYGFTTMLRKLLREERPDRIAVAFDTKGDVFRHEAYADYKANRPPAPEDLNVQVPYAKRSCAVLGVSVVERAGWEADDLIATYTRLAREAGLRVVIVASDKDLLQLVGDDVEVLNPSKDLRLDDDGVEREFGVRPGLVRDVLGLMGDSVDNIPGVPGVGEKTALAVVSTYGDMEAVIARAEAFVALYDARDALLAAVDGALAGDAAADPAAAGRDVTTAAEALAGLERDEEFAERVAGLRAAVEDAGLDEVEPGGGTPARDVAARLRELKRALKGMDKGSSKRIWYAIVEHREQARLSRELATVSTEAPVELGLDDLVARATDREAAVELYGELGFRSLSEEIETGGGDKADAAGGGAGDEAPAGSGARGSHETVLDGARLDEIVAACRRVGRLAVDTETDGLDPMRARLVGIALSWEEGHGAYVPVGHSYLGVPDQLGLDEVVRRLGPLLADRAVGKIGQNWKYDAHVLRRHGLPVDGWVLDTMVVAFLLDAGRGSYSLDSLAAEHLGYTTIAFSDVAGKGAKQKTLDEIDVERVSEYAAEDTDVTLRLAARLEPRLEEVGVERVWREIDGPVLPLLETMERTGIAVDVELLRRMSGEMEATLGGLREAIHRHAGEEFNVDSPKQLREVLFERLGLKPKRKTAKSGVASTDAQTLEELVDDHPIAGAILEYRELAKLKGTYVDSLPRLVHPETGRVHTSYHPTGAATGRLSSSDPNLQNIPARTEAGRAIRSAFVPAEGFVFLASDYSQVELRVLAHLARDPELIAAFQAGEDIHRYTASRVFGVTQDLVSDEMRRRAKAVNFGILYGMSESRLAREQGMGRREAREFIANYFERFAGVSGYIEGVREAARRDGAVRTLFGRVRWFPQLKQKVHRGIQEQALRAAVNTTIQGTAADLMKLAMLRVDAALRDRGSGARLLLQVHDELLLEVPAGERDEVGEIVRAEMEGVHDMLVPLAVDQKTGASWLEVT